MDLLNRVLQAEALSKSAYIFIAKLSSELQAREEQANDNLSELQIIKTDIENLIPSNAENFKSQNQKEDEELVRKINEIKNVRLRADGRYEWRKMLCGVIHQIIERDPKIFLDKYRDYQKQLKQKGNSVKIIKPKECHRVIDLAREYFERHIRGEIKSFKCYATIINNYISSLTNDISTYTEDNIIDFLKSIKSKKQARLCFFLLRYVFKNAIKNGYTKQNVFIDMKAPIHKSIKGLWYNANEQRLIYQNRHKCKIGNEIEFFLLVGCRLSEAFACKPEFDKSRIWVERHKRDGTSGYVNISSEYNEFLKQNWNSMFEYAPRFYAEELGKLLALFGIKRQENDRPIHRLRHTFATNIYYLGAKDSKQRAYLLGHRSSSITDDIYTDFDPKSDPKFYVKTVIFIKNTCFSASRLQ
jgi:integrase